jgi:carboxymethylenebutenolidase
MNRIITIPFEKSFPAYLSFPNDKKKHLGLIIIHEVWGLDKHIKEVSDRFADEGYVVLAPDLLSETGITEKIDQKLIAEASNPATRDEAQKKLRAAMTPIMSPEFAKITIAKLKACIDYLLIIDNVNKKIAILGFCFGGTYAYAIATEDDRIQASVPYYGHAPEPLDKVKTISCPILAFYGEQDKNLVDHLPELKKAMKGYNKDFNYKVYPNTGHAFFNNTNQSRYNREAANDSWELH